jgi:ABC-type sugar transport system ATPase subunit
VTNRQPTRADATPDATPLVRSVGITKYFGGVRALDAVSLDLMPGEVVALVGDNGAGKSTLVKILSGIYQADEGSIWLGDVKVPQLNAMRAREFGIETVYQQLFLCDNLGAAANVMLGQEPVRYRVGPWQILDKRRSVEEARKHIAELGIELHDLNTPVRRLSGGQRQAIAIARATVNAHRLIQFDEPTAALGVRQTKATLDLIQRVAARGVAVIVISHNLDDVFAVAQRVVVLRLGRITLDARVAATTRELVVASMTGMSFRRDTL